MSRQWWLIELVLTQAHVELRPREAETVGGPGGWPALLQLFADETHN